MNRADVPIWFFPTVIVTALSDNNMTHFLLDTAEYYKATM